MQSTSSSEEAVRKGILQIVTIFNEAYQFFAARRAVLINELLSSEQTHVEALKTVVVEHLNPLYSILSKDILKKLFGNFEVIVGWNMQFLKRLRARYEESEDIDDAEHGFLFGDIIVEMVFLLGLWLILFLMHYLACNTATALFSV